MKKNKQDKDKKSKEKVVVKYKRLKPTEFMQTMNRIKMIDEEIKAESKLFDVKIHALELEKEYLRYKVDPEKLAKKVKSRG